MKMQELLERIWMPKLIDLASFEYIFWVSEI
jgi:hypothetical protein